VCLSASACGQARQVVNTSNYAKLCLLSDREPLELKYDVRDSFVAPALRLDILCDASSLEELKARRVDKPLTFKLVWRTSQMMVHVGIWKANSRAENTTAHATRTRSDSPEIPTLIAVPKTLFRPLWEVPLGFSNEILAAGLLRRRRSTTKMRTAVAMKKIARDSETNKYNIAVR
jgi:hypothetical protein